MFILLASLSIYLSLSVRPYLTTRELLKGVLRNFILVSFVQILSNRSNFESNCTSITAIAHEILHTIQCATLEYSLLNTYRRKNGPKKLFTQKLIPHFVATTILPQSLANFLIIKQMNECVTNC